MSKKKIKKIVKKNNFKLIGGVIAIALLLVFGVSIVAAHGGSLEDKIANVAGQNVQTSFVVAK